MPSKYNKHALGSLVFLILTFGSFIFLFEGWIMSRFHIPRFINMIVLFAIPILGFLESIIALVSINKTKQPGAMISMIAFIVCGAYLFLLCFFLKTWGF